MSVRSLAAPAALLLVLTGGSAAWAQTQPEPDLQAIVCAAADVTVGELVAANAGVEAELRAFIGSFGDDAPIVEVQAARGCSDDDGQPNPDPGSTDADPGTDGGDGSQPNPVQDAVDEIGRFECDPALGPAAAAGQLSDRFLALSAGLPSPYSSEDFGRLSDAYTARLRELNYCYPQGVTPPPEVSQSPTDRPDAVSGDVADDIPSGSIDTGYAAP